MFQQTRHAESLTTVSHAGQIFAAYFDRLSHGESIPAVKQELPEVLYFCNETVSRRLFAQERPGILNVGGTLVGCGVGMSLQLAEFARSDRLLIRDNEPTVPLLLWPLTMYHFLRSPTRADFAASVLFETIHDDERHQLVDSSSRQIFDHLVSPTRTSLCNQVSSQIVDELSELLAPHVAPYFDKVDLNQVARGLAVGVRRALKDTRVSNCDHPEYFGEQGLRTAAFGPFLFQNSNVSFLKDEPSYQFMRNLVLSERLEVCHGNLLDKKFLSSLPEMTSEAACVVYLDMVPTLLSWNDYQGDYLDGITALLSLPSSNTTFVYSAELVSDKGTSAAPLDRREFQRMDLNWALLGSSNNARTSDYPGILHSRFLRYWGAMCFGESEQDRFMAFVNALVDGYTATELHSFVQFAKQHILGSEIQFDSVDELWRFVNHQTAGLGRRKVAPDKSPLDPFHTFFVELGLQAIGRLKRD